MYQKFWSAIRVGRSVAHYFDRSATIGTGDRTRTHGVRQSVAAHPLKFPLPSVCLHASVPATARSHIM